MAIKPSVNTMPPINDAPSKRRHGAGTGGFSVVVDGANVEVVGTAVVVGFDVVAFVVVVACVVDVVDDDVDVVGGGLAVDVVGDTVVELVGDGGGVTVVVEFEESVTVVFGASVGSIVLSIFAESAVTKVK